jgi:NTE family protein
VSERLALVLAGGGLAGIGWETGFLLGIQDEAPSAAERLLEANVVLGTSAGSTVGAQITGGITLTEVYERQLSAPTTEITPSIDIDGLMELFERAAGDSARSVTESLREVGAQALAASTVGEEMRRSVIAARLPSLDWPDRRLEVTAIDVVTGERVVFDRDSGVALVDAVAASCAVPLVWPPVTIGGRRFMDGGIGSSANVDLVADADAVVMLAPTPAPGLSPFGRSLVDELAEHPGLSIGFFADAASVEAFGPNPLDPACRGPSAAAGRDQGQRDAAKVVKFLDNVR